MLKFIPLILLANDSYRPIEAFVYIHFCSFVYGDDFSYLLPKVHSNIAVTLVEYGSLILVGVVLVGIFKMIKDKVMAIAG